MTAALATTKIDPSGYAPYRIPNASPQVEQPYLPLQDTIGRDVSGDVEPRIFNAAPVPPVAILSATSLDRLGDWRGRMADKPARLLKWDDTPAPKPTDIDLSPDVHKEASLVRRIAVGIGATLLATAAVAGAGASMYALLAGPHSH